MDMRPTVPPQVGRWYRDRIGGSHGPIRFYEYEPMPSDGNYTWHTSGAFIQNGLSNLDLVEEIPAPAASPVEPQATAAKPNGLWFVHSREDPAFGFATREAAIEEARSRARKEPLRPFYVSQEVFSVCAEVSLHENCLR